MSATAAATCVNRFLGVVHERFSGDRRITPNATGGPAGARSPGRTPIEQSFRGARRQGADDFDPPSGGWWFRRDAAAPPASLFWSLRDRTRGRFARRPDIPVWPTIFARRSWPDKSVRPTEGRRRCSVWAQRIFRSGSAALIPSSSGMRSVSGVRPVAAMSLASSASRVAMRSVWAGSAMRFLVSPGSWARS